MNHYHKKSFPTFWNISCGSSHFVVDNGNLRGNHIIVHCWERNIHRNGIHIEFQQSEGQVSLHLPIPSWSPLWHPKCLACCWHIHPWSTRHDGESCDSQREGEMWLREKHFTIHVRWTLRRNIIRCSKKPRKLHGLNRNQTYNLCHPACAPTS